MTKTVTCKFCPTPVTVVIDDGALEFMDLNKWLSMAACNRCADYREKRRSVLDAMARATRQIESDKLLGRFSSEHVESARGVVMKIFGRFATLACDHYHTEKSADALIVENILENPDHSITILLAYEKGIRSQPRQAQLIPKHNDP